MNKSNKFTNFVLISGIVLLTGICLYAFSRSELHQPGSMNIYYIGSIIGIVILTLLLLYGNEKLKVNLTICFFSLILSIYLVEIALIAYNKFEAKRFVKFPRHDKVELAKKMGLPFDTRTNYQVMMDLRVGGIDAYPNINPYNFIHSDGLNYKGNKIYPLGSISEKTTVLCNERGEFVIYKSDEHGFRNPEGLYNEKAADIVLIGDSFTQGQCVVNSENIAGWLRKSGNSVLNLGMQNSGPLIELAILKEFAQPVKPKFVFWFYYDENDASNIENESKSSILIKYLNNDFSQNLFSRQETLDDLLISYIEKVLASKKNDDQINDNINKTNYLEPLSHFIKLRGFRSALGFINNCFYDINPSFRDIMINAKKSVNSWDGQLVIVYLSSPVIHIKYAKAIDVCRSRYFSRQKQQILALLEELDIPYIDMAGISDSHDDPLSLYPLRNPSAHFNSKGYMLIAEEVEKFLKKDSALQQ